MSQTITKSYTASADPSTWVGRVVYVSADDTVSLHNDPTVPPIGTVERYFVNGTVYEVLVAVHGPSWVEAGETTLDAVDDVYFTGGDDSGGAALDGRAVAATAGDFYVGRLLLETDIVAGGLARCFVDPGQLAQSAT